MHLNQVVFQDQSIFFGCGNNGFDVGDELGQLARQGRVPAVLVEVGAHAAFERARLADVEDFAVRVFVDVNAGRVGQGGELFFE